MGELGNLKQLQELDYIRVTSWRTFEECPHTWAAQYLGNVPSTDTVASKIGTAAHSIMENFQLAMFGTIVKNPQQERWLAATEEERQAATIKQWKIIPEAEVDKLSEYMETYSQLLTSGYKLIALEEEVQVEVPGIPVPIRGHIDARWLTPDGNIMIDDHKTNRSYDSASYWCQQLQQLLYAYMTRVRFPGRRIIMRIGYPNIGRHVEWETDPDDDIKLVERLQRNWALMQQYEIQGIWPKRINDKCKWCPLRSKCSEYELAIHDFQGALMRRLSPATVGEQLEFVQAVRGMVEAKEEELKAQLRIQVATAGGKLKQGDKIWTLEQKQGNRTMHPWDVFDVMNKEVGANPDLGPVFLSMLDDIFTVSVTGVDKLMKRTKAFKQLEGRFKRKTPPSPTLKSMPAGKLAITLAAIEEELNGDI